MPWPSRPHSRGQQLAIFFLALLLGWALPWLAGAQGIESILAPGKVIRGHTKLEDDCKQCHIKFDRKAQSGLCMDCHKEVATDMRAKTGFHGRLKPQACNACHTDHKGRDAQIVNLDKKRLDHTETDFQLRGKHQPLACDKCHVAGKKFREAATQCSACHRKDDTHKGSLGAKCADCHNETNWKEARFDHSLTRFALSGKHADAKCLDCHKSASYRETPRLCVGCHKKDDDNNKGHKGLFGEKCESCHGVNSWKPSTFNHDAGTRYVLRGKHRSAGCTTCHTGNLYRVKLSQDCNACHAKDDKHKESLGKDCASCHSERSWKEPARFDHDRSSFPLLGKHEKLVCKDCHKSAMFKEAPRDCVGCHQKDDKHAATLGEKCAQCHGENDWKNTTGRFDHERTKFPLRNGHAASTLKCSACHKDLRSYRKTPLDCVSCHKKDDKHEAQLGTACEQCHNDKSWRSTKFNHGLTRFPLTGRHMPATCKSCHLTARFKDAPRDCFSCHQKQDKHKEKFGTRCDSCHNTRAWILWDFNHGKRTNFLLDGGHRKAACESCHQHAAPKGKEAAPLGSTCITCHRSEDVHDGQFGGRCEQCHGTDNWKKFQRRMSQANKPDNADKWTTLLEWTNKTGVFL
jgi:hypothetical protein